MRIYYYYYLYEHDYSPSIVNSVKIREMRQISRALQSAMRRKAFYHGKPSISMGLKLMEISEAKPIDITQL